MGLLSHLAADLVPPSRFLSLPRAGESLYRVTTVGGRDNASNAADQADDQPIDALDDPCTAAEGAAALEHIDEDQRMAIERSPWRAFCEAGLVLDKQWLWAAWWKLSEMERAFAGGQFVHRGRCLCLRTSVPSVPPALSACMALAVDEAHARFVADSVQRAVVDDGRSPGPALFFAFAAFAAFGDIADGRRMGERFMDLSTKFWRHRSLGRDRKLLVRVLCNTDYDEVAGEQMGDGKKRRAVKRIVRCLRRVSTEQQRALLALGAVYAHVSGLLWGESAGAAAAAAAV